MIKVGIIGVGGMGTVHLNNYAHIEDCKVVAISDPSPYAKQKADEAGIAWYADAAQMLSTEELDVADICSPTFLHKQNVMQAINAGIHIICEKPLALNKSDAEEMITEAEKKGVQLFVAHVLQYSNETAVLKSLVKSKEYGEVLDAQFLRLSACPRWVKNGWLFDKSKSGHIPFDLHIHDLDLIVSLFGAPSEVSFTVCGNSDKQYKEHYRFLYKYSDKNIAAEAAWYNADIPFIASWRVYFEKAVVICDSNGVVAYQFDKEPRAFNTTETLKIPTGINIPPTGTFHRELSDFLDSIRKGGAPGCARKDEILTVIGLLEYFNQMT